MKKPNAFQENSGATSMRRVLALGCFVEQAYLYYECARTGAMSALYAGMACEVGMLILLFFTTWEDLKGLVEAVKSLKGRGGDQE